MAKQARRGNQQKKAQRFATLRQRRAKKATLFEALERRRHEDASRLQAARRRCIKTTGHPKTPTIERRRKEYLEIPAAGLPTMPPRSILAPLAAAFALPLVLAIVANIHVPHVTHGVAVTQAAGTHPRTFTPEAETARAQPKHVIAVEHARAQGTRVALSQTVSVTRRETTVAARVPMHSVAQQQQVKPAPQPGARAPQPAELVPPRSTSAPQPVAPMPSAQQLALAPRSDAQKGIRKTAQPLERPTVRRKPSTPWSLSPDGTWTASIHAPAGARNADFTASTGQIIALERSAVDGEAATVTIGWSRPVVVTISSSQGTASQTLPPPDDGLAAFAATARAVGPHLVNVGWTPLAESAAVAAYKVYRSSGDTGDPQLVAELPASKHSWHDLAVSAQSSYRYDVVAETETGSVDANTELATTPDELSVAPASVLAGKGMFLYFLSVEGDARSFRRYDPEAVIAEAQKANIRVIELRMARGSCPMAQTSQARAWLNRLVDSASRANISLIAWTVPRRVTTKDVSETVAAAAYQTPSGNGFAGLALDLETGDHYMGYGQKATASLVQYIKIVRSAVGPHYLIVATVASPEMGNHTNEDYPYAKIARYADVLQPMEYWHYFYETAHHEYVRREVAGAAAKAVARTRELAGRDIPVNVAGQTVDLEGTGSPSGREISWSLNGAKSAGGIGETFFDWAGTRPDAWAAIQAFDW